MYAIYDLNLIMTSVMGNDKSAEEKQIKSLKIQSRFSTDYY